MTEVVHLGNGKLDNRVLAQPSGAGDIVWLHRSGQPIECGNTLAASASNCKLAAAYISPIRRGPDVVNADGSRWIDPESGHSR